MTEFAFPLEGPWDALPGWFHIEEARALQAAVARLPRGARVVELGSFHGRSSVAIAAALPPQGLLFCIDHFRGSAEHQETSIALGGLFDGFLHTIERFGVRERVRIRRQDTVRAAGEFPERSVDLILHDASHELEAVVADLTAWYPKLKPGGELYCDDYEPGWPGVIAAVRQLELVGELVAAGLWRHVKPHAPLESV